MSEVLEEQQIAAGGRLWFKKKRNGHTDIGFTDPFLELVHECWHISPATTEAVRENMPLLAVESNEALFSVLSPASGTILFFNDSAMNFPDKLKPSDIICTLGPASEKPKVATPTQPTRADRIVGSNGWAVSIDAESVPVGFTADSLGMPTMAQPRRPEPEAVEHGSVQQRAAYEHVMSRLRAGRQVELSRVHAAGIDPRLIGHSLIIDDLRNPFDEEQG